ncbi:MAG: cold shock domain-containing protein [Patescibacteria group bacterium]
MKAMTPQIVVLPFRPTFDKALAYALLSKFVFIIERIFFEDEPYPTNAYDIDVRVKYGVGAKSGVGSATEFEVNVHDLLGIPGIQFLVEEINRNNKTGCLKNLNWSFVRLVRECWEYGNVRDADDPLNQLLKAAGLKVAVNNPQAYDKVKLITRFAEVVYAYLDAQTPREGKTEAAGKAFVQTNFPKLGGNDYHPFQLGGFLLNLYLGGKAEEEIIAIGRWWEKVFSAVKNNRTQIGEVEEAIDKTFQLGKGWVGVVVRSDNTKVANQMWKRRLVPNIAIVLAIRNNGNVAILTRVNAQVDLAGLARVLEQQEPGMWHYETRYTSPMILNGSTSRSRTTTDLSVDAILNLIDRWVNIGAQYVPPRLTGTVKFWGTEKKFGFIVGPDGTEYFVSESGLGEGVKFLVKGRKVTFISVQGDKGPKATDVRLA